MKNRTNEIRTNEIRIRQDLPVPKNLRTLKINFEEADGRGIHYQINFIFISISFSNQLPFHINLYNFHINYIFNIDLCWTPKQ